MKAGIQLARLQESLFSLGYAAPRTCMPGPKRLFLLWVRRLVQVVQFHDMKPRRLRATTIAMAVLNLGGFVGIDWNRRGIIVMVASVVLLGYAVIWSYWLGRNWARIFVMFTSILTIVNLLVLIVLVVADRLYSSSVLYHCVIVANASLGAFLLYWLNKKNVSVWFRKSEPAHRILL